VVSPVAQVSIAPKGGGPISFVGEAGPGDSKTHKRDELASHPAILLISASGDGAVARLREVWEYRQLLGYLTWRDVGVRYKQTVLGVAWAVLQPLMMMAVYGIIFGALARVPSDGLPYPVFALCGLVPWQLFAFALSASANSLVNNERLVTKIYFPRLIIPIAAVLSGLVDFLVAFLVLAAMMVYYRISPTPAILLLPLFVMLGLVAAIAVGIGLAALNVRFRDVRHGLPFLTQLWMLATPIAYPSTLIPEAWRPLIGLNPMAGVVEGFRWALLGSRTLPSELLLVSVAVVLVFLGMSVAYFLSVERSFADVI
jgi:lipopolysaccharide transport system permease protein